MSRLRLGPIEEEKPVKLTIELSGALMRELRDYAAVHAKVTGLAAALPPERIVPPMIERFMATDREFGKMRRRNPT